MYAQQTFFNKGRWAMKLYESLGISQQRLLEFHQPALSKCFTNGLVTVVATCIYKKGVNS